MANFEDFLSEGKKLQIKRKYTENHPAQTVGKTANVRNAVLQAIKDGVVTREEFNKILSELSTSSSQWASRNRKYFNVSEEGIKLSKWGMRILAELDETPKTAEVFEATVEMDAINPDDKDFLKFLKKNKVKIINKEMDGPGGGHPVITMQGKRKDLEKVLADPELGWDDPDLAEYIEESVNEKIKVTKDKWPYIEFKDGGKKYEVEFDDYDVIDDHGNEGKDLYFMGYDQNGDMWEIDVYADYRDEVQDIHYDTLIKVDESVVTEAKPAGLSKRETLKVAQKFAAALSKLDGMKYTVSSDYEEDSFDLDIEDQDDVDPRITGEYAGGSYNINADGSVVNMAVWNKKNKSPVYGDKDDDIKTIMKTIKNLKESAVTEKFIKDFDKDVLDAETKADITTYYPSAKFFMGKMTHFFGELEPNLYFKAYYAKYYKQDTGKSIKGDFKITSIYSEKGRNYVHLYNESVVTEAKNDGNLDTIADYVQQVLDDGKSFMDIGKKLKGAYKYDFNTGMMPMYTIPVSGNTIVIINKKYVENGQADRIVGDIAIGLMENIKTEITNMENTFSIHESFASFTAANGFLNEKLGSQILSSILMGNKEGKYGKKNLSTLAGGFYQMTKVALDKIQDEDFLVDNDPQKAFKNHGGSNNIIFFISDNEKENPYLPGNSGSYGSLATIPGGGILLAAMGGDREFYTNDWSRYSQNRAWKKDGKKGAADQIGVNKKYRGWDASGLSNGKRIAEVSDRVIIVNLDLIRQKYSTQQLRDARQSAKAGAIAFKSDKDFKADNVNRYHKILATKAASLPLDKMVSDAIDLLATQIKDGLAKGDKTRYEEIKIGENAKGKEVKLRDASNHMSNILDNYSRYCDYIRQGEESKERYGQAESYYERESKNYAKEIKDQIAKIKGFDYAW